MFPERLYRVTDPESMLEGSLTVLRGSDGGASAVVVELRNLSDDHDVIVKVNSDISAFIMFTVTDQHGAVLSRPARKFNSSEYQRSSALRIEHASSHNWCVPIAGQLSDSEIPEQGMKGRLVVSLALLFDKVSGVEQAVDANFKGSLLTLYDMDVLFTKAALSESVEPAPADP
jgi:hypothetical protein